MKKDTEKILVFAFGLLFITTLLVIAIAIPEPTKFQWNIFKTILALSGAAIAAFLPGFINVEINNYIRAGGSLAVFVILFFYNPAELVVDIEKVDKKYSSLSFQLGEDIEILTISANKLLANSHDTVFKTKIKNEIDSITLKLSELKLANKIGLIKSPSLKNIKQVKDNIYNALMEKHSKQIAIYCKVGWELTDLVYKLETHDETQFSNLYKKDVLTINANLKLIHKDTLPDKFTNKGDIHLKIKILTAEIEGF
jgi:hypothetical protein